MRSNSLRYLAYLLALGLAVDLGYLPLPQVPLPQPTTPPPSLTC